MGAEVGQCGYYKKCAVNESELVKKHAVGGPEVGMGWAANGVVIRAANGLGGQ